MRIFLVSGFFLACSMAFSQKTPLQKLDSMGLKLPATTTPMANYVKFVRTGNFIFTSGNGPTKMDGQLISGTLGADLTIEQGYEAAQLRGLQMIATLQQTSDDQRCGTCLT